MNRVIGLSVLVVGLLAVALSPLLAQSAASEVARIGGRPLSAILTGDAEVPGPGDPDGSGTAILRLNSGRERICFNIEVADIEEVTAAHIHVGTEDESGPIVVDFDVDNNGLRGCVDVERRLVKEIRKNPEDYYVNVHNGEYPAGALRGQLAKGWAR